MMSFAANAFLVPRDYRTPYRIEPWDRRYRQPLTRHYAGYLGDVVKNLGLRSYTKSNPGHSNPDSNSGSMGLLGLALLALLVLWALKGDD